jgi:hypothetical protein
MVPVKVENRCFPVGMITEIMLTKYRAPTGRGHDRGLTDRSPGGAGVVVRANPGLVGDVDGGPGLYLCASS